MNNRNESCNAGVAVLSFLTGALVGAAVALLTAPKTGRETREMLVGYGEDLREKARHLPEELRERTGSAFEHGKELIERGKELIERGTEMAHQGKDYLEEKKRTLSAAIEAGKKAMEQEKEALSRTLDSEEV